MADGSATVIKTKKKKKRRLPRMNVNDSLFEQEDP